MKSFAASIVLLAVSSLALASSPPNYRGPAGSPPNYRGPARVPSYQAVKVLFKHSPSNTDLVYYCLSCLAGEV